MQHPDSTNANTGTVQYGTVGRRGEYNTVVVSGESTCMMHDA
jgi:hypothetical protein